jgi:hypothetical protein
MKETMQVHGLVDMTDQSQPKVEIPKVLEMAEVEFLPQVAMLLEAETQVIPIPLPMAMLLTLTLSIGAKS